jgi:hypothetical protein
MHNIDEKHLKTSDTNIMEINKNNLELNIHTSDHNG